MVIRICVSLLAVLSCSGCAALSSQLSDEMEPRISTEVALQVGTAVVEQVATVLAKEKPAEAAVEPVSTPVDSRAGVASQTEYDCAPKYCKDMTSCEEAVYKLAVCGFGRLDGNNDGVPCESICNAAAFAAVTVIPPTPMPIDESARAPGELTGLVTRVIDGDTIDVLVDDETVRIRYVQTNTPERDEPCFRESTQANADLVANKTVRLLPSKRETDRYGRLLRFVYVGDVMVERALVEDGWAEVVLYPPNDAHYDEFVRLEQEAAAAGRGCHPTGVFDDGSTTR